MRGRIGFDIHDFLSDDSEIIFTALRLKVHSSDLATGPYHLGIRHERRWSARSEDGLSALSMASKF